MKNTGYILHINYYHHEANFWELPNYKYFFTSVKWEE